MNVDVAARMLNPSTVTAMVSRASYFTCFSSSGQISLIIYSRIGWCPDPDCPGPPEFTCRWVSWSNSFPSQAPCLSSLEGWGLSPSTRKLARLQGLALLELIALGQPKQWEWESWKNIQDCSSGGTSLRVSYQVPLKVTSRIEPTCPQQRCILYWAVSLLCLTFTISFIVHLFLHLPKSIPWTHALFSGADLGRSQIKVPSGYAK